MPQFKNDKEPLIVYYNQKKGTAKVIAEKRFLTRIPVNKKIFIWVSESLFREGKIINISGSGALISVDLNLSLNHILELRLNLYDLPFAKAQVARVAKTNKEYGIRWLELYEDQLPKGFLTKTRV